MTLSRTLRRGAAALAASVILITPTVPAAHAEEDVFAPAAIEQATGTPADLDPADAITAPLESTYEVTSGGEGDGARAAAQGLAAQYPLALHELFYAPAGGRAVSHPLRARMSGAMIPNNLGLRVYRCAAANGQTATPSWISTVDNGIQVIARPPAGMKPGTYVVPVCATFHKDKSTARVNIPVTVYTPKGGNNAAPYSRTYAVQYPRAINAYANQRSLAPTPTPQNRGVSAQQLNQVARFRACTGNTIDSRTPTGISVNPNGSFYIEPSYTRVHTGTHRVPVCVDYQDGSKSTVYAAVNILPGGDTTPPPPGLGAPFGGSSGSSFSS